jgi:hypothetical protein
MAEDDQAPSTAAQGSAESPPGMPRWVKYLIGALLAVVVAAILIMLIAGGDHGPGRHGAPAGGESPARSAATSSPA